MNTLGLPIEHYPLPWPGSRVVPRQDIGQLFCEEKISRGKNGTYSSYNLSAVKRGLERLKLVSGLDSPEKAIFLEQQQEGFLGITNRPVPGEIGPG